jgi:hypothetical protein
MGDIQNEWVSEPVKPTQPVRPPEPSRPASAARPTAAPVAGAPAVPGEPHRRIPTYEPSQHSPVPPASAAPASSRNPTFWVAGGLAAALVLLLVLVLSGRDSSSNTPDCQWSGVGREVVGFEPNVEPYVVSSTDAGLTILRRQPNGAFESCTVRLAP